MTPALILIDCQRDFGAPDGAMAHAGHDMTQIEPALLRAQALAAAAREAGVPVIFVRLISEEICADGTPGAAFIGPQPQPGEAIVTKSRFSAFARTGLAEDLRGGGIDTVVLAGLTTECCVQASAWAALEDDFEVLIAADACAAYDPALHRGALKALQLSGAGVADAATIAAGWK
jgi:ureidoacrylate peracid hydrolase